MSKTPTAAKHDIVVIGGGLAGMVAAYELASRGLDVGLYESSERLGGKAGSDAQPPLFDGTLKPLASSVPGGVASDHGYHIFPKWYVNMRALWARIGIDAGAALYEGANYLEVDEAHGREHSDFHPEATLTRQELLAVAELVTQADDAVDGFTLQSFLRSRPYLQYQKNSAINNLVLNALTVGDADLSARAIRNVFRQWLPVFTQKNWDMFRTSLQEGLIDPLEQAFTQQSDGQGKGTVYLHHSLIGLQTNNQTLSATISDNQGKIFEWHGPMVMAVPFEVLRDLDNSELFHQGAGFSELNGLRANQFSALDIFFNERLPDIPLEHFTLAGSRYGLTAVDIGQHWPTLMSRGKTVLQFVAGRSTTFRNIDDQAFLHEMQKEIARYFPQVADPDQIECLIPHRNAETPLYVNEVNQWQYRLPAHRATLDNVWFAGDHVRNETDVASMESAVRTGLVAAEGLRRRLTPNTPDVQILDPVSIPLVELFEGSSEDLGLQLLKLLS